MTPWKNDETAMQRCTVLLGPDQIVSASSCPDGSDSMVGLHAALLVADINRAHFQGALDRAHRDGEAWFLFCCRRFGRQWVGRLQTLAGRGATGIGSERERTVLWEWRLVANECCLLSPRQREILLAFSEGLSPGQIARTLGISPNTVRTHLLRCQNAVHCYDHLDLLRWACHHRRELLLLTDGGP